MPDPSATEHELWLEGSPGEFVRITAVGTGSSKFARFCANTRVQALLRSYGLKTPHRGRV